MVRLALSGEGLHEVLGRREGMQGHRHPGRVPQLLLDAAEPRLTRRDPDHPWEAARAPLFDTGSPVRLVDAGLLDDVLSDSVERSNSPKISDS